LGRVDHQLVIDLARVHQVRPQLLFALEDLGTNGYGRDIVQVLSEEVNEIARKNLLLACEMARIGDYLRAQGIRAIPFKGPVLGHMLYGSVALREQGDLDFLIRKEHTPEVRLAMRRLGYRYINSTSAERRFLIHQDKYYNPDYNVVVEFQWRFNQSFFVFDLPYGEVEPNLRTVAGLGHSVETLGPVDELLVLLVHGTRHHWELLKWLMDIAMIMQDSNALNWQELIKKAESKNVTRMVLVGLNLAHSVLGAPLAALPGRRIEHNTAVQSLTDELSQSIRRVPQSHKLSTFLRLMETTKARLAFGVHSVLVPTTADASMFRLKEGLHWLYYLTKPVRVVAKYVRMILSPQSVRR
jgi:hypothetical protein